MTSASTLVGGIGCGSGGTTGTGGSGPGLNPANKISDYEDTAAATVVMVGTPPRNGYWYSYNDDNPGGTDATCKQTPISGPQATAMNVPNPTYIGEAPPNGTHDATTSVLALHAMWTGCGMWGAGIGADLNQPMLPDGGTYTGKKVIYDVTGYSGVTFWATAGSSSDTSLRIKFPMSDETKLVDGGDCDDAAIAPLQCSDDYGEQFNLPSNGTWKQFTIKWRDAGFKQEGWGKPFTWNPQHVTSIQIQSVDKGDAYDFWIDDLYFIN